MVADGYKQTEYGLIPNDWVDTEFQNALDGFSSGMTPYRGNPEYYKGAVKWITSGELNYNTVHDTIEHISLDAVKKTNLKILPKGTFLMAITGLEAAGTRGSCAIVGSEATTNQSCMAIFPTNKLSIDYFYHFYVKYGNLLAFKYCQGTKQQSYTAKIVKVLPIVYPSDKNEQQAIATALSDTDELINSLEKLISKKEAIKTGTMQELLTGKKRLDGFSGEWEEKKLENVIEFTNGKAHENSIERDGNYIVINSKFISTNGKVKKYTNTILQNANVDDIAMVMSDVPNGKAIAKCFYIDKANTYTINQRICLLKPIKVDPKFLFYILDRHEYYLGFDDGAKQTNLRREDVLNCPLFIPRVDEQIAISTIIYDMNQEIRKLKTKLSKVKAIKEGMMQELLTGRVRLV